MNALFPAVLLLLGAEEGPEPIRLHPRNPHYFLFRGKPTVLITSGEHYGAVLNLDFDYLPYLDELAARGFNLTRTFSGAYREIPGSFGIRGNTLAPAPGRYICPWARSETPGYFDGGAKFDLGRWDPAYFERLKDFLAQAARRGVVVELVLFCPMYEEKLWKACPMFAGNNVNGVGDVPSNEAYTLKHPKLLEAQEALARKLVGELREFDNLYYEIANEPYFGGVTLEWQGRIARVIAEAEAGFPRKHLIAQNIANYSARIERAIPEVSVFNFHYASPPEAVAVNYRLERPIGFDESGFRGPKNAPYRTEAWDFIVAGGAVYDNLDYSFTPDNEGGDAVPDAPGGGGPSLRKELQVLKEFIQGFDFIRMAPDAGVVQGGVPPGMTARALSEPGKAYAIYLAHLIATGPFSVRWTGRLEPRHSEEYTLHTFSNDGVRLWVDGRLLVDNWTDHAGTEDRGKIALAAGKAHELKLEYYQNAGGAAARLEWSSASQPREVIPPDRLRSPDGEGGGLRGEYFEGKELKKPRMARKDAAIDFDWTEASPFAAGARGTRLDLRLDLPPGKYRAEWIDTRTGGAVRAEDFEHPGGARTLPSPEIAEDIALRVKRAG